MIHAAATQLNLAAQEQTLYEQLLSHMAGREVTICALYQLSEGANSNTHLAAELNTGETFGLKAVTRVGQGCLREKVAADIAELLRAPNACPCRVVDIRFGLLQNRQVNVIRWLNGGRRLDRFPPKDVKRGAQTFFRQFGEWALFSAYFGLSDRANGGNWVYNAQEQQLAMVDMEDAFEGGMQLNFVSWAVSQYANQNAFRDTTQHCPEREAFVEGILAIREKYLQNVARVATLLQEAGLAYNLPPITQASEAETTAACIGAA